MKSLPKYTPAEVRNPDVYLRPKSLELDFGYVV